jgi:proton-dependent oligopeptide transporter, POT family
MIPIFCHRRFYFLTGAQLNRIRAANERGGKNETANDAQQISIHANIVPSPKAHATARIQCFNDVTIHFSSIHGVVALAVAHLVILSTLAKVKLAETEVLLPTSVAPDPQAPIPRQIRYIIGNEGCERFSFYGMRNILTVFLVSSLLLYLPEGDRARGAKDVFHTFVIGVYFFPLLGGWLADRFYGKYNTILWLSLVYCVGQAFLAMFVTNRTGFYIGLGLIALGSGGIKPCVAAFVGDQFDQTNKHRAKVVFDAFYWIINFGSFFASLLMPIFLRHLGPAFAFGVPGVLMFISTVIFWLGRKQYVMIPPAPPNPHSFLRVSRSAIASGMRGQILAAIAVATATGSFLLMPKFGFVIAACLALVAVIAFGGLGVWLQLDAVRDKHPADAIAGARSVLRVLVLFALVTPFWSLFDQKASTWVLQADAMDKPSWFQPSQMQALNPMLVMLLIPFNNLVLYPALMRFGYEVTALRRMTAGIVFAGLSWIVVGAMQLVLDHGDAFSITWQMLPYALLTFGEVLVATTGLEFAYSQAPLSMKGAIMSFWNLSVTIGNLWVLVANAGVQNASVTRFIASTGFGVTAFQMFFFAGFAFAAALAFGIVARTYPVVDHYRKHVD